MKHYFYFISALLYFQTTGSCLGLSKMVGVSHDSFTRFLRGSWSGQKRLEMFTKPRGKLKNGYLIIDDTPSEKPYSKSLEGLSWVYSSKERKPIYGYCTVLLIWTDGKVRIPIGLRLWKKGGTTKIELALELLSYARNHLGIKPEYVLFDSWYASKKIFKRLIDYGWYFVTCLKRNRNFEGEALTKIGWQKYFHGKGRLSGGIKVSVVKNGRRYYASNKLTLTRKELLFTYSKRMMIEEVNRILKQECCWKCCQVDSINAQENHLWCSLFAFAVLELESKRLGITIYELRKTVTQRGSTLSLPLFEEFKACA